MSSIDRLQKVAKGKYLITEILGKGGVAITYGAIQLETNYPVAIKVISLKQLDDWKQIELFQREAEILKQLEHPAIPKYIDYFEIETHKDKIFCIVQEIASGKSLVELVKSGWRASEKEIRNIAQQVLEILSYLHSLDPPVIHRDIKPNNLIRDDDGKIYLVDFGAVKNTYYNTLMQGSTVVGTYGYMSPEQFRGQALPATDLYGLGATILYLLTHRSPAELPQDTLKLDFKSSVNIDDRFAEWLDKILEPELEDRFDSANIALIELNKSCSRRHNKTINKIAIIALLIGLSLGFNYHKWFFLSRVGYSPSGMCSKLNLIESYIEDGGTVNIAIDRGFNKDLSLLHCVIGMYEISPSRRSKLIKILLEKGINIDRQDSYSNTPLLITRELELAKLLISYGADVNARDKQGNSTLHRAITNRYINDLAMAKLLIEHGADVSAKNDLGNSVLQTAIEKENRALIDLLINNGVDVAGDEKVLFTAVSKNNLELVKLLIDRGVNVEVKDYRDNNILFHASSQDNLAMVKLFVDLGVDPKHKNSSGENGLTVVKTKAIAEFLIDRGADINTQVKYRRGRTLEYGTTPLLNAIALKNRELVELLLENGAEVNFENRNNENINISKYDTPLIESVKKNNPEIVRLLLNYGADIHHISQDNKNIFLYAKSKDIAQLLIDRGINIHIKGANNNSLLFEVDNLEAAQVLIENGADVNAKNSLGNTPLFYTYDAEKIELLINSGAAVDVQNHHGETPSFEILNKTTTSYRKLEALEVLVANGANVNAKNILGQTPFSQAIYKRNIRAVNLFLQHGADTSYLDIEKIDHLYQLNDHQFLLIARFLRDNNL